MEAYIVDKPEALLTISAVSKKFGEIEALSNVDVVINSGQVIGLVGGNGAGKTTLLRLISGVLEPTTGSLMFKGKKVSKSRERIGVVPESTGLYARLTAWENIRFHSRIYGIEDSVSWARTFHFAKRLEIKDELSRHTKGFSRGMRQKIALLRALAHGPDILLLDEPTAGLDVTSARTVRHLVGQLRDEGGTVIYSTHHLAEAEQVCDRIIIVHNGTIRADGHPEELIKSTMTTNLEEAYVELTKDKARPRSDVKEKEGRISKWWSKFLTGTTPKEVGEDE